MPKLLDPQVFRSPHQLENLTSESPQAWVDDSGNKYPVLSGGIPILVPDARVALAELKTRAHGLIQHYERNVADLKSAAKDPGLAELTRARLANTREIQIHHVEFLKDLLSPLKLGTKSPAQASVDFGYQLPPGQGLQGYFPNLVRDWSSKHGENEAQLELLKTQIANTQLGRCVFAGSGGGRLAYDVHQLGLSTETICCDLSVVLTLAAARISRGETLKIAEFPVAPRNVAAAPGMIRECKAPAPAREGLFHVIADVYHLPFANQSLDTVITPWLVDILPHRLEFIASEINRVLKPSGRWINSGSFNFRFANWSDCLSPEEGLLSLEKFGFQTSGFSQDLLHYLKSDLDAHQRSELVTSFTVVKTGEAPRPVRAPIRPAWLTDPSIPVPTNTQVLQTFASLESQAFVLTLVDGKRTLVEIASAVSQRYSLPAEEALDAVISFLSRLEDNSIFKSNVQA